MKYKFQKVLSLLVVFSILCSLAMIPASAETSGIAVNLELKNGQWSGKTYTVDAVAIAQQDFKASTIQFQVSYDKDVLNCTSATATLPAGLTAITNPDDPGVIIISASGAANINSTNNQLSIMSLVFEVKDETVEKQTSPLKFEATEDGTFNVAYLDDNYDEIEHELSSTPLDVEVPGIVPTLDTITFDKNSIEVDGSTGGEIQTMATSAKGTDITGNVAWTVSPADKGVTIANDGKITVDAKAVAGTYTIKADGKTDFSQGSASADLVVTRATPAVQSIAIYQGDTKLGANATIINPTSATPNTYTYTVMSTDQYGDESIVDAPSWGFENADSYVTFASGVVTVNQGATNGNTYTLKATVNGKEATVMLTVKDIDITWPTVNKKAGVYGDTWAAIVTFTGGSASLNGENVPGTFVLKEAAVKPNAGETNYTLVFTSNDGKYTGIEKSYSDATVEKRNISNATVAAIPAVTYTGSAHTPEPAVTDLGGSLLKGTDFDYSYDANTDVGPAKVTINGKGNYTGSKDVAFTISKAVVTLTDSNMSNIEVYANDSKNTSATELAKLITKNQFTGQLGNDSSATVTFDAVWALTSGTWDAKGGTYTYTATLSNPSRTASMDNYTMPANPTVDVVVKPVTETLTLNPAAKSVRKANVTAASDLTVLALSANVSATYAPAEASATDGTYTISGWDKTLDDLKAVAASVSDDGQEDVVLTPTFSGRPDWATPSATPTFTLTITGKIPVTVTVTGVSDITYGDALGTPAATQTAIDEGTDPSGTFTYSYKGTGETVYGPSENAPTNAGTYEVTATLVSATHSGKGTLNFTIGAKTLADAMVGTIADQIYSGSPLTPAVTVTDGTALTAGTDYTVEYTNNINAGTATVKITGIGNYSGDVTRAFDITKKALTQDMVTISGTYTYTGEEIRPTVVVKDGEHLLTADDYTLTYENNINAGTATVKVTGKTNYDGEASKTFTIAAAPVSGMVVITDNAAEKITVGTVLTANTAKVLPAGATLTYQWYKNDAEIVGETGSTYTVKADDEGAKITVAVSGSGNYTGNIEKAVAVEVGKTPVSGVITSFVLTAEKDASGKIILNATVTFDNLTLAEFNASLYIQWYRDGIAFGGKVKLSDARALNSVVSYEITPEDAGKVITCKILPEENAENAGYTGEYSVSSTAGSPGNDTANGTLNNAGDFTVPANTVPGAPTGVTATVNGTSMTINWTAPVSDGNQAISKYHVILTPASGNPITAEVLAADGTTTYTFTGVAAGTYTVTVTAENSIGTGTAGTAEAPIRIQSSTSSGGSGSSGGSNGSSSSRGGGGGSSTVTNRVSTSGVKNGSVSVNPRNPVKGNTVTLTVRPNTGYSLESIRVVDTSGNEVELTKVSDTKYTFKMPSSRVSVDATFTKGDGDTGSDTTAFPFADAADNWAKDAIAWAYEKGYINGTSATTFNPNGNITRQQMWMILARLNGQNPSSMAEARQWAIANGVSDGTNGGNAMTRQQMVTFLYRYAQLMGYSLTGETPLTAYPDSTAVSNYAQVPLSWAVGNGIVNGTTDGTLNPGGTATRAQFATILQRFYNGVVG